jgi:hypothetical protein
MKFYYFSDLCSSEDLIHLHGNKYTLIGTHYEYTIILGKSIEQKEPASYRTFSLGDYSSTGNGIERYRNGDWRHCPSGITREADITFVQGEDMELVDVTEQSICKFEFVIQINCKGNFFSFISLK